MFEKVGYNTSIAQILLLGEGRSTMNSTCYLRSRGSWSSTPPQIWDLLAHLCDLIVAFNGSYLQHDSQTHTAWYCPWCKPPHGCIHDYTYTFMIPAELSIVWSMSFPATIRNLRDIRSHASLRFGSKHDVNRFSLSLLVLSFKALWFSPAQTYRTSTSES